MSTGSIRKSIRAASRYLAQHPDQARSTDSAAVATLVDGLIVRVTGPAGASITTDMAPSVGGTATAPSPGWLLRAAEASCVVTLIAMRAAMLVITLDTVEVTVDSESDDRGLPRHGRGRASRPADRAGRHQIGRRRRRSGNAG